MSLSHTHSHSLSLSLSLSVHFSLSISFSCFLSLIFPSHPCTSLIYNSSFHPSICPPIFVDKQSGREQDEEQGQRVELGSSPESYLDRSTGWDSMNDISATFPLARLKVTSNLSRGQRQSDDWGQGEEGEAQGSAQGNAQGCNNKAIEEGDLSSAISGITLELLTVLKALRKRFDCSSCFLFLYLNSIILDENHFLIICSFYIFFHNFSSLLSISIFL